MGLDRRHRRQQQPVLEQAAAERAQLRVEVVEALGSDAAEALAVGDQDGGEGRRRQFRQLDLPHLPARLPPQVLDRALAGFAHRRRHVLGDLAADDADPQPADRARPQLLAEQGRTEQAAVGGVGAEGAGDDRGRGVGHVVTGHRRAAEGRLQPGEAAVGRRIADRADPIGSYRAGHQPGGDRGGGAARGAAWAALGVPRVARGAVDGDRPGAAGAQLVHVADADDHRARLAQGAVGAGLARRRRGEHVRRPEPLRPPGQRPLVLDHDRDAVERSLRHPRQHLPRALGEGLDDRVQRRVALVDPRQRRLQQLAGIDVPGGDRRRLVPQREVERLAHRLGGACERSGADSAGAWLVSRAINSRIGGQNS
jgi:hypothetical protein